ncbi:hypothetical protein XA68_15169 [Ophiocordyceps unilateralis]|uniref:Glutamate dehydrogenase n=1 Tax=Ophiocordyceps unilateralis TaxID=268505 RepID=A0A2A9PL33_OPHUN|nr:hypothetical protein XA68_15169 [Ophiocordyceps unilateralis]
MVPYPYCPTAEIEFEHAFHGLCPLHGNPGAAASELIKPSPSASDLEMTLVDSSLFEEQPEFRAALRICAVPERVMTFRVVWEDDAGKPQVNIGYRVQFNSALGPYKGGVRFHRSVNLSILKFLSFEQTFKNALTGLNMGGAKGGANFDSRGKSDNEIRRFCQAYMRELSNFISLDSDVPAGDIGVSMREIGYMFGTYRQTRAQWDGVLTGDWGGSMMRPEATGYGLVYYVEHMLKYKSLCDLKGLRVAISGCGNVAKHAALKAIELGAVVCCLSDSQGALIGGPQGLTRADVERAARLQAEHCCLIVMDNGGHLRYLEGFTPWRHVGRIDVALPCATQNEFDEGDAVHLLCKGLKIVAEGSVMACTKMAVAMLERERQFTGVWYAPSKAASCGGVAVSGLENAQFPLSGMKRDSWTSEEVNEKLKAIMKQVFDEGIRAADRYASHVLNLLPSLRVGSNIAAFIRVAQAMKYQGDYWA